MTIPAVTHAKVVAKADAKHLVRLMAADILALVHVEENVMHLVGIPATMIVQEAARQVACMQVKSRVTFTKGCIKGIFGTLY